MSIQFKSFLLRVLFPSYYDEYSNLNAEVEKIYTYSQEVIKNYKEMDERYRELIREYQVLDQRSISLSDLHNDLVDEEWGDKKRLMQFVCSRPFERISVYPDGSIYTCPIAGVKFRHNIGNIFTDKFETVWNSKNACRLRLGVSKGNFEYCNRHCKEITGSGNLNGENGLQQRDEFYLSINSIDDCVLSNGPKKINLYLDESCNLHCPSCRKLPYVANKTETDRIFQLLDEKIAPLLPECEILTLLITGDFFSSNATKKFVRKHINHEQYPKLRLFLMTNAQLLNEKTWSGFPNLKDVPIDLSISIDAASRETYEKLRRGGKWEILINNLDYILTLKRKGQFRLIRFNFLVQKDNCGEIVEFAEMARRYCVDEVWYQRLSNWGTYNEKEFETLDVLNPAHPQFNSTVELLNLLQSSTQDLVIKISF